MIETEYNHSREHDLYHWYFLFIMRDVIHWISGERH